MPFVEVRVALRSRGRSLIKLCIVAGSSAGSCDFQECKGVDVGTKPHVEPYTPEGKGSRACPSRGSLPATSGLPSDGGYEDRSPFVPVDPPRVSSLLLDVRKGIQAASLRVNSISWSREFVNPVGDRVPAVGATSRLWFGYSCEFEAFSVESKTSSTS